MSDDKRRLLLISLISVILALMGFIYASIPQDIAFEIVKNNTDLCVFNHTTMLCDGIRQNNITYYTNDTPIVLYIFAHANTASQTAGVFVYRDNVLLEAQSGRPLAVPEETWRGITVVIPRNSSYRANITNFHHFEWREDQILSGRNGTLSINQTIINNAGGGGVSFDGSPVNANGSTIYNATYIGSMNYTNITNTPRFEQLIYQNHTCCFNRTFINLTGLSINNDSFYKVYSVMNSTVALTLDMFINNDLNSNNYSREYVFAAGATLISAYDLSTNISVNSAGESGQSRVLIKRAWNGKTRAIIEGNFDTLVFFNMQLTYNVPVDDVHTINFRFTPATPTGLDMDVYALR